VRNLISLDTSVTVTQEHVSCVLADEVIVLNLANGQYFELNPVGARIWELLRNGNSLRQVRDILLSEYEVDEEQCTSDLLDVLAELATADLVRLGHEPSAR
jgi:hypothetical protein